MQSRRNFLSTAPFGALALAAGTGPVRRALAAENDAITVAVASDVTGWDPVTVGSPTTVPILRSVFDMPLEVSPDLHLTPALVTDYRWLSAEGKSLELTLRSGATFQNGDPLTSEDFKFTFFERPKADNSLMISGVWGSVVEAVDTPAPNKVVFHFTDTYVDAVPLLADIPAYVMPKKYYETVGHDEYVKKPIGSGPYRLVEWERDSRVVLEAYDKYWRGPPAIKRVTFQIIKDPAARMAAIEGRQVDFIDNIPVRDAERLGALPGLASVIHPIAGCNLIHMVNKGVYQDKNLRLAMHHAIDKQALSKAFFGGKAPPQSMFESAGAPGNDPNFVFHQSVETAKALLAKSGYGPDKPVQIAAYTFNGVFTADYDVARAVVEMWKKVGIVTELRVLTPAQYFDMTRSGKIDAPAFYRWAIATGDPQLFSGLILDPRKRYSVWKSDDIPPKLDPVLRETDFDKRMAGYKNFDEWAVEQGYEVPLIQSVASVVHSKRVSYTPFANGRALPYYWHLT